MVFVCQMETRVGYPTPAGIQGDGYPRETPTHFIKFTFCLLQVYASSLTPTVPVILGGKAVLKETLIKNGDVITVGSCNFRFAYHAGVSPLREENHTTPEKVRQSNLHCSLHYKYYNYRFYLQKRKSFSPSKDKENTPPDILQDKETPTCKKTARVSLHLDPATPVIKSPSTPQTKEVATPSITTTKTKTKTPTIRQTKEGMTPPTITTTCTTPLTKSPLLIATKTRTTPRIKEGTKSPFSSTTTTPHPKNDGTTPPTATKNRVTPVDKEVMTSSTPALSGETQDLAEAVLTSVSGQKSVEMPQPQEETRVATPVPPQSRQASRRSTRSSLSATSLFSISEEEVL